MSEELKTYQPVLVRDSNERKWRAVLFSHKDKNLFCASGAFWEQCIPYEGNEHLVGTTDAPTPPEPEFRWGDHVEVRNDKYNDWKKALFCNRNGGFNMCLVIGDSIVTGWRRCRHADW